MASGKRLFKKGKRSLKLRSHLFIQNGIPSINSVFSHGIQKLSVPFKTKESHGFGVADGTFSKGTKNETNCIHDSSLLRFSPKIQQPCDLLNLGILVGFR